MRVLKDDKYQAILQAARREFSGRGFKDASMRGIARRAGVGLSNIYNYFRNKDELYRAVVIPAQEELFDFIARQHTEDKVALNRLSPFGHDETVIDRYIDLIDRYRTELKLLLCHSEGSSAAGFRDAFADYLTRVSRNYMEIEKKHYPGATTFPPFSSTSCVPGRSACWARSSPTTSAGKKYGSSSENTSGSSSPAGGA